MTLLGWSAALTGALGYGIASLLQALGSARATGPAVLRQPAYVAGLALDGLAWLASLVALRVLPLFVVQATLGGSVAVTVVLAHRFLRAPLRRRDAGSIVLLVAALAVLAGAFLSGRPAAAAGLTAWALSALAGLALALAVGYHRASSLPLAAVAGLAFSGAAVCARGVDLTGGPATVAAQPLAWALLGFGAVGTLGYARSLERGPVGPATAALWSVESVVAGVAGVLVLGDTVRPGWTLAATLAAVVSVLSCAALATSPAEKTLEPSAP